MDFPRFFSSTRHGQVVLAENFRSRQPIIDAAEAILHDVGHKIAKHGRSMLLEPGPSKRNAVYLPETGLFWRTQHATAGIWHAFSQYVGAVLGSFAASGSLKSYFRNREDLSVFILARTNAMTAHIPYQRLGDQVAQFLRQQGLHRFRHVRVRIGTFHRSKGLEADFVLLQEDSLLEMIFGQAPFLSRQAGTYLQNVTDESKRLAHVAVTRARFGVMWVPLIESSQTAEENEEGAPGAKAQSDASIST
jgi:superfamily I DNA/RNA helicase